MRTISIETAPVASCVPEEAFAAAFGDPDRVRIALWIDRAASQHGGLFALDTCAARLDLPESAVREALKPLRQLGLVRYRNGLYERCDHTLWGILATLRREPGAPKPSTQNPGTPKALGRPRPDLAATFYFG
jgi:DNA-binding transcriptional ArsR family regulator